LQTLPTPITDSDWLKARLDKIQQRLTHDDAHRFTERVGIKTMAGISDTEAREQTFRDYYCGGYK